MRLGSKTIGAGLQHQLWHLARGYLPDWLNGSHGAVGWVRQSHRGVQFLDQIHIGQKQKRDIFNPKFSLRFDQAFEQVLEACADPTREGKTWITPEVVQGYITLFRAGYAHSFECWMDEQLVGGAMGVQIGGWITVDSMFHRVNNASKAAYGQLLGLLRDRGFVMVDVNVVSKHMAYFGAQWVPTWRFEQLQRQQMRRPLTIDDSFAPRLLPRSLRAPLALVRMARAVSQRVRALRRAPAPVQNPPVAVPAEQPQEAKCLVSESP